MLVRALSEHDFGVLSLLYAVIPLIGTVASLGIEQTLRRYQPEYLQAGKLSGAAWLVRAAASARFLTNLLVLGAIVLAWSWIAPLFHLTPYRGEFAIFCVLIVLHFQASILQLSLSSHMLQAYSVGGTVALAVAKLIGYLILIYFGHLTLTKAILVDMAGYGLMYAGLRVAYARHCQPEPGAPPFDLPTSDRKRLLRYSLYNNFNDVGTVLLTSKSDSFFIAALLNPIAVGAYAFYVRLSEMTSQLLPVQQFSNVITPLFFATPRAEATQRIPRYFTLLLNLTMIVQLPIAAYFTAYHREIVQLLFGGKFLAYSWLLPMIALFATVNRVADPVILVAQYEEKVAVILWSKLAGIYNAVTMLLFVPWLGLYGAALSTGSAQALKNLYIWWRVRDMARWINFPALFCSSLVIWGLVVAVCYALKAALPAHPWLQLLCGAGVCGLATLIHIRSPAISSSDRQLLSSLFHGRERHLLVWLGLVRPSAAELS